MRLYLIYVGTFRFIKKQLENQSINVVMYMIVMPIYYKYHYLIKIGFAINTKKKVYLGYQTNLFDNKYS